MAKKILAVLFLLAVILLGIDGIYYLHLKNQPSLPDSISSSLPSPKKSSFAQLNSLTTKPVLVDIINSPLSGITKAQVEQLAEMGEITNLELHNPPLDEASKKRWEQLSSASAAVVATPSANLTKVMAGKYQNRLDNMMVIKSGQKEIKITLSQEARLWINTNNKLQIVSTFLPVLAGTGALANYVKPDDLMMAVFGYQPSGQNQARWLVVFK